MAQPGVAPAWRASSTSNEARTHAAGVPRCPGLLLLGCGGELRLGREVVAASHALVDEAVGLDFGLAVDVAQIDEHGRSHERLEPREIE